MQKIILTNPRKILYRIKVIYFADMAELADALDLGSSVPDVQVQVLLSAVQLKALGTLRFQELFLLH